MFLIGSNSESVKICAQKTLENSEIGKGVKKGVNFCKFMYHVNSILYGIKDGARRGGQFFYAFAEWRSRAMAIEMDVPESSQRVLASAK